MPKLRPYTAKARAAQVVKGLVKHKMNQAALAREQGVTQQAISKKIKQPEVQKALAQINETALRKAGATIQKIYQRTAEGLDATKTIPGMKIKLGGDDEAEEGISAIASKEPDFKERRESAKLCLELTGRIKTANSEDITKPTEIHVHYGYRTKSRAGSVREE